MFGGKKEGFCPLIKDKCKGKECKFWRLDDCSIAIFFETQGVGFFNQLAEMEDEEKAEQEKKVIDYTWLTKPTEEVLIKEIIDYSLEEFPDEKYLNHSLKQLFWKSKGLLNKYDLPADLELKIDKIESKADNLFSKQIEENERKRLHEIIDKCYTWAKSQNSNKLTKSDINAYVMESEESLTQASKDILYSKVNMKLKNPKSLDQFKTNNS